MTADPFRIYAPDECGTDEHGPGSYPFAWHDLGHGVGVKDLVREQAGNRCQRCSHPYTKGMGEWSPCDDGCRHGGPVRLNGAARTVGQDEDFIGGDGLAWHREQGDTIEARWRILTVHHLTGEKADLRWWNLAALCQRCHLQVQRRVVMDRPWPWPHTPWFQLHAAAWYALKYSGVELDRAETIARMDELLEHGQQLESVERMAL